MLEDRLTVVILYICLQYCHLCLDVTTRCECNLLGAYKGRNLFYVCMETYVFGSKIYWLCIGNYCIFVSFFSCFEEYMHYRLAVHLNNAILKNVNNRPWFRIIYDNTRFHPRSCEKRKSLPSWLQPYNSALYSEKWRALVNVVINRWFRQFTGNFMTSWGKVSFSRRTLLHAAVIFKYLRHEAIVVIAGRDREKLKELQNDATGYMLTEIIWRKTNKLPKIWWFLCCPNLKIPL